MNETPPQPHTPPDDERERDAHDAQHASPAPAGERMPYPHLPAAPEPAPEATAHTADAAPPAEAPRAPEPPPSRLPPMPPPMPTFGPPQSAPRPATTAPRPQEPPRYGAPPAPPEQPAYPPRPPVPQPAPPGGMNEPPRPYEGGRYVPPPPIPPSGPTVPSREWSGSTVTPAVAPAPQPVAQRGSPLSTGLLGLIAVLLLALAVFQGINTFRPKGAKPTGVQQVQVQKQTLKPETVAEIKDTIDKAQTALNQFNQQAQQAYGGAMTDAQRQATLLQLSIFLQQIIAQQNNDLLLVYQDLNS